MTDIKTRDKALSDIPDSEEDDIWELKPIKWKIKIADKAKNSNSI